MKQCKITVGANGNCYSTYLKIHSKCGLPGLLYAEIIDALSDYDKFERGIKGTRFDTWLERKRKK